MSTQILFADSIVTPLAGSQDGDVAIFAYVVGSYSNTNQQIDTVSFASESNATDFFEYGDISYITYEGFFSMFSVSNGTHAIIGGGEHRDFNVKFGDFLYKYEFKSQSNAHEWGYIEESNRSACGSLGDGVYGYIVGGVILRVPGDSNVSYFPNDCNDNIDIISLDSSFAMSVWSSLQYTTFHMTCVSDNKTIGIIAGGVESTCDCYGYYSYNCEESLYTKSLSKIEYSSAVSNDEFNELSTPRSAMASVGNATAGIFCAGGDCDDLNYAPWLSGARHITNAEKITFSSLAVNHSFGGLEVGGYLGGASNGGAYGLVAGDVRIFTKGTEAPHTISKIDIDTDAYTQGWGYLTNNSPSDFTVGAGSYVTDVIPPQPPSELDGFDLYTFLTFDKIDFNIEGNMDVTAVRSKSLRSELEYKECKLYAFVDVSFKEANAINMYDTYVYFNKEVGFGNLNDIYVADVNFIANADFRFNEEGYDHHLINIDYSDINNFNISLDNKVESDKEYLIEYDGIYMKNVDAKHIDINYHEYTIDIEPVEFELSITIVDIGDGGGWQNVIYNVNVDTMGDSESITLTGTVTANGSTQDCTPSSYIVTSPGAYEFISPGELGCDLVMFGGHGVDHDSGLIKHVYHDEYICY